MVNSGGTLLNKVAVWLVGFGAALVVALISYVYVSDVERENAYRKSVDTTVKEIAKDVKTMSKNLIINDARLTNVDARMTKSEKEFERFKERAYRYWQK